jgi:hypothetical protein
VWWWALLVAACGAVATAHGLFEVVAACGVARSLAWLYVPITDGLALVAYACTARLTGAARGYAWCVVVMSAGLSGLAQAVNLAGLGDPDWKLKFGVGYWPAVAVAVAAHLLWLVADAAQEDAHAPAGTGLQLGASEGADAPGDDAHGRAHAHTIEVRTSTLIPAWPGCAPAGRALLPVVAHAPDPKPATKPRPVRVQTRDELAARRKVRCDCGCGSLISKSQRTRHRAARRAASE